MTPCTFSAEVVHEAGGCWSACVGPLPGCGREAALAALDDAARARLEVWIGKGGTLPSGTRVLLGDRPLVAATKAGAASTMR